MLTTRRSGKVRTDLPIPAAPYLERKVRAAPHLAELWSYINPFMLYGKNLGYKGNFEKDIAQHVPLALELFHKVEDLKAEAALAKKQAENGQHERVLGTLEAVAANGAGGTRVPE